MVTLVTMAAMVTVALISTVTQHVVKVAAAVTNVRSSPCEVPVFFCLILTKLGFIDVFS